MRRRVVGGLTLTPAHESFESIEAKHKAAQRTHELLINRCSEISRQLEAAAKKCEEIKADIDDKAKEIMALFARASLVMAPEIFKQSLMYSTQAAKIAARYENSFNISMPKCDFAASGAVDTIAYGFAFTSCEMDDALALLEQIFPDMIELEETENAGQRLDRELVDIRARLNMLENAVITDVGARAKYASVKKEQEEICAGERMAISTKNNY